jgi:hypothetical protein
MYHFPAKIALLPPDVSTYPLSNQMCTTFRLLGKFEDCSQEWSIGLLTHAKDYLFTVNIPYSHSNLFNRRSGVVLEEKVHEDEDDIEEKREEEHFPDLTSSSLLLLSSSSSSSSLAEREEEIEDMAMMIVREKTQATSPTSIIAYDHEPYDISMQPSFPFPISTSSSMKIKRGRNIQQSDKLAYITSSSWNL